MSNPLSFTDVFGRRHTEPSVTGTVEVQAVEPARGDQVNDLIFLSQFRAGEPNVLRRNRDLADLETRHDPDQDGDQGVALARVARAGFGDVDVNGAADMLTVRVGRPTQSSYTIQTGGAANLLLLETGDYGSGTKQARLTSLGGGTVLGKRIVLTDSNPRRVYVGDNLGIMFAIQYVGAGASCVIDILYSNGTLTYTGQPTDGDTVLCNGHTFEFDSNDAVTGGNVAVDIGTDADTTFANLVLAMVGLLDGVDVAHEPSVNQLHLSAPEVGLELTETSAAISVTVAPPAAVLRTKVAAVVDLTIALPLQQFSTIDALAKYIDSLADYTAIVSPYANKFLPSTGLDAATAVGIKNAAVNLSGYVSALADFVNTKTQGRFTATEIARGDPAVVTNGIFMGGTTPAATAADWVTALNVVGANQERGGIIHLDTDDASIFAAASQFCIDQRSNGKWFRVYWGARPGLTRAEYERIAQGIDNTRCRMFVQRVGTFAEGGAIEYVAPAFLAAAVAGGAAGNLPYKPLTNRRVRFAGIHPDDVYVEDERAAFLEAGINVVKVEENNVVLTLHITTSRDPSRRMPRIASEIDTIDLIDSRVREGFLPLRGKWGNADLETVIRGTLSRILDDFTREGALAKGVDEAGNPVPPWRVPTPAFVLEAGVMQLKYQIYIGSELNHISTRGRAAYARIAGEIRGPQNVQTAIPL